MRLVAQPLYEVQRLAVLVQQDRFVLVRQDDLFVPLRKADGGNMRKAQLRKHLESHRKLRPPAIHDQQAGRFRRFAFPSLCCCKPIL